MKTSRSASPLATPPRRRARQVLARAVGQVLVPLLLALLAGVAPLSRAQAATFEVNLTTDVGDANPLDGFCDSNSTAGGLQCTLRAAIDQANVGAGGDRIEFDIPGAANAVQTISLTTELPDIQVANIVIDGYTQGVAAANTNALIAGGTNAVILIELAGSSTTANGLNLAGGGATVRGLSISGFAAPGGGAIVLTSENNTISGCFLGTNAAGGGAASNYTGVQVLDDNNTIGGAAAADRNLISNNTHLGIEMASVNGNDIQNNLIGTSATGLAALPNVLGGISLNIGTGNTFGGVAATQRNVIAGNNGFGIRLDTGRAGGATTDNQISGNLIGLRADGTAALPNGGHAIEILDGAQSNRVGAARPDHNIIVPGAGQDSVHIDGTNTDLNTVAGNIIGLDEAGTTIVAPANAQFGISISGGAQRNAIGNPAVVAERNTIAGHTIGIAVQDAGTSLNVVRGNYIGTNDAGGFEVVGGTTVGAARANGIGVSLSSGSSANIIGGTGSAFSPSGGENTIGSTSAGPAIQISASNGNQVLGNRIGSSVSTTVAGVLTSFGLFISDEGVAVDSGSSGNFVGGTTGSGLAGGNSILNSGGAGVGVTRSDGNRIGNNSISFSGTDGVSLVGSSSNLIGVDAAGASQPNRIAANNRYGVLIQSITAGVPALANANTVQGNTIGAAGGSAGNTGDGVRIDSSPNNIIGRAADGTGVPNSITQNGGHGINIIGPAAPGTFYAQGNTLRANAIGNNGKLGINLTTSAADDAPTPTDIGDGPNNFLATPVINSATFASGATTVSGTLTAAPGTYAIDLFSSAAADASTYGEGEAFVAAQSITVPAAGTATFSITTATATALSFSATATNTTTGGVPDTSEFSLARTAAPAALTLTLSAPLISEGDGAGAATGTVTRNTSTIGPLTVALSSSDTDAATVPGSVTIPDGATSVSFAIAAVEDNVSNDTAAVTITATATGLANGGATITVSDNDAPGISVAPTTGLETTETGGEATFTVALNTAPRSPVTITFTSSDTGEGTLVTSTFTFTRADFSTPQTVRVRGADDSIVDGARAYTITGVAASAGADYAGRAVPPVSVTNTDNDTAALPTLTIVLPSSTLAEGASTTATITRSAAAATAATVTVTVGSGLSAPADVTIPAGATTSAPFTITADDDRRDNGNRSVAVAATSTGFTGDTASLLVTDDDVPAIIVTPTSGLSTSEGGGTSTFRVSLATEPSANVTIALSSRDTTEATVSPSNLTFTAANYATPQVVTVRGVDDSLLDGDQAFTIAIGAAVSADASYSGRAAADVAGINQDNDLPRLTFSPSPSTLREGSSRTLTISRPGSTRLALNVALSSSDTSALIAPAFVPILPGRSSASFTVRSPNDAVLNPGRVATLSARATGFAGGLTSVSIVDNDVAGVSVVPPRLLFTSEGGASTSFTVRLSAAPTAPVSIAISSSDPSEGVVSPSVLSFSPTILSRTVSVRGVDDAVVDGTVAYSIITGRTSSSDRLFNNLAVADVRLSNRDNDTARLTLAISPRAFSETAGARAATGVITRNFGLSGATQVLVSSADPGAARVPRSVTIRAGATASDPFPIDAVDDRQSSGPRIVAITVRNGALSATQTVTVGDNDSPALSLAARPTEFSERAGASASTGTVSRNTRTTGDLIVALRSGDPDRVRVPATVRILSGRQSATFTIGVLDNGVVNAAPRVSITASAPTFGPASLALVVADDEAPSLSLSLSPSTLAEGGPGATATLRRNFGLARALTVALSASDASLRLPASATFSAGSDTATFSIVAAAGSTSRGTRRAIIFARGGGQTTSAGLTITDGAAPTPTRGPPLQAWGYNQHGQIGDATTQDRPLVVDALDPDNAIQVSAGGSHSLALQRGGAVFAWGFNISGQIGDGTNATRPRAVRVLDESGGGFLSGVTQLAAGWYHSLALLPDGTVLSWGRNNDGELGDGTRESRSRPVRVGGLPDVRLVAAGVNFSAAIARDGSLWTWGRNTRGQLGNGSTLTSAVPVRVVGEDGQPLANIVAVSLGAEHALALRADGVALAWGANQDGQLAQGGGREVGQDSPRAREIRVMAMQGSNRVPAPRWKGIAAGYVHSALLSRDGRVFSCGNNFFLQLGRPAEDADGTLRPVVESLGSSRLLSGVTAISAGAGHTVAQSNGRLRAWGWNQYGTLGDGTFENRAAPVEVRGISNVRLFSSGYGHTLALAK